MCKIFLDNSIALAIKIDFENFGDDVMLFFSLNSGNDVMLFFLMIICSTSMRFGSSMYVEEDIEILRA